MIKMSFSPQTDPRRHHGQGDSGFAVAGCGMFEYLAQELVGQTAEDKW